MAKRRKLPSPPTLTISFSESQFQLLERAASRLRLSLTDFALRAIVFEAWLHAEEPVNDSADVARLIELDQWPPGSGAGIG